MTVNVSLKELIESGAHFGHQSRRWNPKMAPYLYEIREGVHIFDLTKTKEKLEAALNVLKNAGKEGKTILFVGTKKQAKEKVKEIAQETKAFYITERWLGGILTNFEQIKKSTAKLADMKAKFEGGEYKNFTKKEKLLLEREMGRLERFFGGISEMKNIPDLIVIVDVKKELGTVREALVRGVTTIGIVDSNSNPVDIDYPIPMNDDATKAIEYVLTLMGDAILEGKGVKSKSKVKSGSVDKKGKSNSGREL